MLFSQVTSISEKHCSWNTIKIKLHKVEIKTDFKYSRTGGFFPPTNSNTWNSQNAKFARSKQLFSVTVWHDCFCLVQDNFSLQQCKCNSRLSARTNTFLFEPVYLPSLIIASEQLPAKRTSPSAVSGFRADLWQVTMLPPVLNALIMSLKPFLPTAWKETMS